jgi:hypothetical protein
MEVQVVADSDTTPRYSVEQVRAMLGDVDPWSSDRRNWPRDAVLTLEKQLKEDGRWPDDR